MSTWLILSKSGRKWKKPILRVGEFVKKAEGVKFSFTQEHLEFFAASFKNKIPVPLEHTVEPDKNRGWVTDMLVEGDVLYGVFELSEAIEDPMIYDTSVFIPIEGGKVQPIEHVALTSYPVVDGLGTFEAIACSLVKEEEKVVAINWANLRTTLELSEDLTEDNVVEVLTKRFKAMGEQIADLELSNKKLMEERDSLSLSKQEEGPKITIENLKKTHGKLFNFAKDGKKAKIESLPLSKAVKDKLVDYYCSDEVIALSLTNDAVDDFEVIVTALSENEQMDFSEMSGVQLSQLPDERKVQVSGLVANAQARADAVKNK